MIMQFKRLCKNKNTGNVRRVLSQPVYHSKSSRRIIQTALKVGETDDTYEKEADRVADQIVGGERRDQITPVNNNSPVSNNFNEDNSEEDEPQKKALKNHSPTNLTNINKNSASKSSSNPNDTVKKSGNPLQTNVRKSMERKFAASFEQVRVHTDSMAADSAREIGARAYTLGNHIVFGTLEYQPTTTQGEHLLAHELTHVLQQGDSSSYIQRDETEEASTGNEAEQEQTPAIAATAVEQREYVQESIRYMTSAAEFFSMATITQSRFESVLTQWISIKQNITNIINNFLSADETLLQSFRQVFTTAVRSLFTRASSQLNIPLIQLYTQNVYRLPSWTLPQMSDMPMSNQVERESFINSFITSLNDATVFGGSHNIDQQKLESILSWLNQLVSDSQIMIVSQLNSDQTTLDSLREAYANAIEGLLTSAAASLSSSRSDLYQQYRFGGNQLIHEWADQRIGGLQAISTPLPIDVSADPLTGEVRFLLNGVQVIILPDGTQNAVGGKTNYHPRYATPGFSHRGGLVTEFTPPNTPEISIQTLYGPAASPTSTSAYGRGTTVDDRTKGNTSLGFHEGEHGRDFLAFIRANPIPTFTGRVGMSIADFEAARQQYQSALATYFANLGADSERLTDCVGTTIEQHHQSQGTVSPVTCP